MKKSIVLLPGWTASEKFYSRLIHITPPGYSVFIPKYSELLKEGRLEGFNDGLIDFFNRQQLTKVILLGHSLGGALAVEFAAAHPERVEKLFLTNSAGVYGGEGVVKAIWNVLRNYDKQKDKRIYYIGKGLLTFFKEFKLQFMLGRYAIKADLKNRAKNIKIPTTLIWGEKDCVTPLWQGQELHRLIPNSEIVALKDEDHNWILHSPEKFWVLAKK